MSQNSTPSRARERLSFLEKFGFVANQEQFEPALWSIMLMFSMVPAFFAVCKAVALWTYPLNRGKVIEIEHALAQREENY